MQDKFYNWYKKSFDNLTQEPPEEVWEGIINNLDKKTVVSSRRSYANWLTGGVVLLLIGSVSWMFLSTENQHALVSKNVKQEFSTNTTSLKIDTNTQIQSKITDSENIQNNNVSTGDPLIAETKSQTQEKRSKRILKSSQPESFTNKKLARQNLMNIPNALPFAADAIINIQTDNLYTLSEQTNTNKTRNEDNQLAKENVNPDLKLPMPLQTKKELLLFNDSIISSGSERVVLKDSLLNKHTVSHLLPTGFYVGSSFILNNSWLLNHDTYNGLKSSGLNDVNMYFGHAFALITGYNYSDNFSIQAEWLLYNKQGQKYKDYIEGSVINRDELLTYGQYNIIFKKKNSRLISKENIPVSFNTILGLHYDHLQSAHQVIDGEIALSEDYRKSNYGVILGIGFETYVYKHWMLATSLRSNIGLKNIYAGNQKVPTDFKKTYNSALEINFTAAYLISSKN